jgi:cytochrome c
MLLDFSRIGLCVTLAVSAFSAHAESVGDPDAGKKIYRKCASCHMVGDDARNRVGPNLNNIIGAPAANIDGVKYSKALKNAAADGLVWDEAALNAFLEAPKKYLPGTRMSFRGLTKPGERADVIAYLATYSDSSIAPEAGFSVSPEILAMDGDVAYGEYLGSECTTCHLSSGANDGIPGITGWDDADFVTAMHAYKEKYRDNSVMQMIAGRLANDEIAALAAYFKNLEK